MLITKTRKEKSIKTRAVAFLLVLAMLFSSGSFPATREVTGAEETEGNSAGEGEGLTVSSLAEVDDPENAYAVQEVQEENGNTGIMMLSLGAEPVDVTTQYWSFSVYYVGEDDRHYTEKSSDFNLKYQIEFHASEDLDAGAVKIYIEKLPWIHLGKHVTSVM